mmetsp:Transcript_49034/g.140940  ORF Transcript_49034/g.140940 Transcript_49034/m.140940 type:complete len:107 (-) Transcript_49034:1661-1981(-)
MNTFQWELSVRIEHAANVTFVNCNIPFFLGCDGHSLVVVFLDGHVVVPFSACQKVLLRGYNIGGWRLELQDPMPNPIPHTLLNDVFWNACFVRKFFHCPLVFVFKM